MITASEIAAGERSAVEVLEEHLARIEELNGDLNAIVLPRFEAARAEAEAVDRGERTGPLAGVPFTCKDPLPVEGMRSPNGSKLLADFTYDYTCEAVRRLQDAGAILLGKTNVSEFSMFWDSSNPLFGSTRNPHDRERSAGGSSGGEACAVASGMSALGLGSDLGGSIRAPAHFCGVYGLRAGRGTIPCAAHHPLPATPGVRQMGSLGPLARTLDDIELALSVLAPDAPPPRAVERVAVFEEDGLQPVSAACREAVRTAAAAFDAYEARPPSQAEARRLFDAIAGEEIGGLPAFVGDRDAELASVQPRRGRVRAHVRAVARALPDRVRRPRRAGGRRRGVVRAPSGDAVPGRAGCRAAGGRRRVAARRRRTDPARREALALHLRQRPRAAGARGAGHRATPLPVGVQLIGWHGSERTLIALAREIASIG